MGIDSVSGTSACLNCGFQVSENLVVSEIGFQEGSSGKVSVIGELVSTDGANGLSSTARQGQSRGTFPCTDYRAVSVAKAKQQMQELANALNVVAPQVDAALRIFKLAMHHSFLQGRKTNHVVAACLYIACRRALTPHMLLDFSEVLSVNVYILVRRHRHNMYHPCISSSSSVLVVVRRDMCI